MNKYLAGIIIVLILALGTLGKKYNDARKDRDRHENNYTELKEYSNTRISQLELTEKEFATQMDDSVTTLLDSLAIKPKRVLEYIHIHHYDIDTVTVEVPVYPVAEDTYAWHDTTGCFKIKGIVEMCDTIPRVYVTEKIYNNSSDYILYEGKRTKKFLLFRYGDRKRELKVVPQCGKEYYKKFVIIKK